MYKILDYRYDADKEIKNAADLILVIPDTAPGLHISINKSYGTEPVFRLSSDSDTLCELQLSRMTIFTIIFIVSGCLLGLLGLVFCVWFLCNKKTKHSYSSPLEDVENQKYGTNDFQRSDVEKFPFDTGSR